MAPTISRSRGHPMDGSPSMQEPGDRIDLRSVAHDRAVQLTQPLVSSRHQAPGVDAVQLIPFCNQLLKERSGLRKRLPIRSDRRHRNWTITIIDMTVNADGRWSGDL